MKLLFATQNPHKIEEIKRLVDGHHELLTLHDLNFEKELPEHSLLLEENAIEKVNFVYHQFKLNCFSEDTGIEVAALNGAPGALSARYAGEEKNTEKNIEKLLSDMKTATNRTARFRTVIALVMEGKEFLFEGVVKGTISFTKKGSAGFGYDPVFIPEGSDKTFAEMAIEEKSKISHRARAYNKLNEFLNSEFAI